MAHADRARDPCPYVILNDAGGAFSMGAIGGTIWYAIKGSRNSPRVSNEWWGSDWPSARWMRRWSSVMLSQIVSHRQSILYKHRISLTHDTPSFTIFRDHVCRVQ
jgi:hypothetical protein